jgi:hypothetical protein
MIRRFFVILFLALLADLASAQGAFPDQPTILYTHQQYGGFLLNSNGFGGFFTYGKYQNASKIFLMHSDLSFIKHEKEEKRYSADPNARGYFYGKLNSFAVVHAGVGYKKIVTEKLRKNGVQLSYNWLAGPAFGFTKPIYLEIFYPPTSSIDQYRIEVERYDPSIHYIDKIYGRASGLRGFNQIKFHPGGFAKFGVLVEYANYRDGLKGIEVGAQLDVFATKIPIMAEKILEEQDQSAKNHQIFPSFYLNFFFGKKYNKI